MSGATRVFLATGLFGALLVANGITSIVALKIRGRDATVAFYRTQERWAPRSIRVGAYLLILGIAGGALSWITT